MVNNLRDKLKLGLSEKPPEGGESTAMLAEKIKALRAKNAVEAAVERIGTRLGVAAERPVTARMRARKAEVEEKVKPEPGEKPIVAIPEPARLSEGHLLGVVRRREPGSQMRLF